MDLITPGLGLVFWTAITFLCLLFILRKFAWKPILNAVSEREEGIKDALASAENAKKEMQNLHADNEKLLKQAREEREMMMKEARQIKESMISEAKDEAKNEATKIIESAKASIEQEKQAAVAHLKKQVAELSIGIAETMIKRELASPEDQLKMVEGMLEEVHLN